MTTPRDPKEVKVHIKSLSDMGAPTEMVMSRGACGAITNTLNLHMGGDMGRRLALAWLFDYDDPAMSSKLLDNDKWWALGEWINARKDAESNTWLLDERFVQEAPTVVKSAIEFYHSQGEMLATAIDLGGVPVAKIQPVPVTQEVPHIRPSVNKRLDYEF